MDGLTQGRGRELRQLRDDGPLRLLLALVKLPPRNGHNGDAVARRLRVGKDKTNSARRSLREAGHRHGRKRQHPESGGIRDPNGPVARIRAGMGIRDVLETALDRD